MLFLVINRVYTLGRFCRKSSFLFPVKEKEKGNFSLTSRGGWRTTEIEVKISARGEEKIAKKNLANSDRFGKSILRKLIAILYPQIQIG